MVGIFQQTIVKYFVTNFFFLLFNSNFNYRCVFDFTNHKGAVCAANMF
jgi:hypothetical protein